MTTPLTPPGVPDPAVARRRADLHGYAIIQDIADADRRRGPADREHALRRDQADARRADSSRKSTRPGKAAARRGAATGSRGPAASWPGAKPSGSRARWRWRATSGCFPARHDPPLSPRRCACSCRRISGRHARRDDRDRGAARRRRASRRAGGAWLRYWLTEFRAARRARPGASVPTERPPPCCRISLQDVRYSLRLLVRTPGVTLRRAADARARHRRQHRHLQHRQRRAAEAARLSGCRIGCISSSTRSSRDRTQQGSTTPGNFYDIQRAARGFQQMAAFADVDRDADGPRRARAPAGRRQRRQRARGRRRRARARADLHRGGRPDRRAEGRRDQRPLLAADLRRARRCARPDDDARRRAADGRRRDAAGFTFPDTQIDFWAPMQMNAEMRTSRTEYLPDRSSAVSRQGVDAGRRARRARRDHGAPARASSRRRTARSGSTRSRSREALVGEREPAALDPDGQRRLRAAHRLRESRQPAAGAGDRTRARDRHPAGDRRRAARASCGSCSSRAWCSRCSAASAACWSARCFSTALVAWLPAGIPRIEQASVDMRVLLVHLRRRRRSPACSSASRPALQLARRAPAMVLRDDARTSRDARRCARCSSSASSPSRSCCSPAPDS